ncbi:MAG TPA: EamA family transporter [Gemmatimonadaceae bacterium]|nr:EamA family transporter [Gemmatimonadaceae bacterium]
MSAQAEDPAAAPAFERTVPGASLTDLLLVLMSFIWGINYSVVKFGTSMVAPLAYNAVRITMAAVALLLGLAWTRRAWPSRRDLLTLLVLGMIGNGVYQILFIEGVARSRAGDAALVLAASPAFIAILGRALGVERISTRGVVGIALSLAGMAFVVYGREITGEGGDTTTLLGNLLVLAGSLAWALYSVLLKPRTDHLDVVTISAFTMLGGAIVMLAVGAPAMARTDWRAVGPGVWGAMLYSGLFALVLAYLFWYRGVQVLGPTRTAMYSNLQPVIALGAAWAALGEVPTPWQAVGAGTIIAGVVLTRT